MARHACALHIHHMTPVWQVIAVRLEPAYHNDPEGVLPSLPAHSTDEPVERTIAPSMYVTCQQKNRFSEDRSGEPRTGSDHLGQWARIRG